MKLIWGSISSLLLLIFLAGLVGCIQNPSLPALMKREFDGRDLKLVKILEDTDAYTRYHITYMSGKLKISGIMNIPKGQGPFPIIITAHGYIDPKYYTLGRGLKREQDYLARHGYVVIHPDYRNHAFSSKDPDDLAGFRLGYVEDVINAVYAVKSSSLKFFDKDNIGLLGHSLGGGIGLSMMVTKPGLVKAYVLFAPVSSDYRDNFSHFLWKRKRHPEIADKILSIYGSPEANRGFWDGLSPRNYFSNIKDPVVIHHGISDESVPIEWSEKNS